MVTRYVNPHAQAGGDGTTNGLTGATCAYQSLNIAEAALPATLTDAYTISCETEGNADVTAVTFSGITTSATNYISVETPATDRHDGKWNTAKYRIETGNVGDNTGAIHVSVPYVRLIGLQIKITLTGTYQYARCVYVASDDTRVGSCVLWSHSDYNNHTSCGVYSTYASATTYNCALLRTGTGTSDATWWAGVTSHNATGYAYNVTAVGYATNFYSASATLVCKNCISQSSGTAGYNIATSTGSSNNISDRADAPGTDSHNSLTLSFTNAAAGDLHLANATGDNAYAVDGGVSDPGSGLFSDDIDGVTRSGTWDIGADEYVSAASTVTPSAGALSLSGQSAIASLAQQLSVTAGSLAFTGTSVSAAVATTVSVTAGSLTWSGFEASLVLTTVMSPATGTLAVTGQSASGEAASVETWGYVLVAG